MDGRFRLSQCLGQGGSASVWLAQHLLTGERVVLKVLHAILTSDEERLRRFRRGSEQMSRLSHPNILKVLEPYRVSSDGDTERPHARRHFVVLEWASRGDLAVWSRKQKHAPSLQEVLQTGIDAASALAFAHAQGCIHRDVKPHNLLRMADGTLKLTDFDLANLKNATFLIQTGFAGAAYYIAPELMETMDGDESTPITESVDIYSLGWTLVALLKGNDIIATDLMRTQNLLNKLQMPEPVQQVVLKAVELEPADRYQTMTEFREALVRVREQASVTPAPAKPVVAASDPVSQPLSVSGLTPVQALEAELAKLPLQDRLERLREWGQKGDPRLGLEKEENWIWIPPGEFMMGSNDYDREKPIHHVKLTQGFYLSRFPVTNHDFKAFIDAEGYRTQAWWSKEGWAFCQTRKLEAPNNWTDVRFSGPNQPVVGVSWYEAEAFCHWMTQKWSSQEGRRVARLPSEAEWEYAVRGKEGRHYPWGKDDPTPERANYGDNIGQTSPVGTFPLGATPEGVHDMAGNVWEWCEDWYGKYPANTQINPSDFITSSSRVLRGGSWLYVASNLRGAGRIWSRPSYRDNDAGFRIVWSAFRGAALQSWM